MQPPLHREGYAIFVRCCDLSHETPVGEFVATIETLDRILFAQIGEKSGSATGPVTIITKWEQNASDAPWASGYGLQDA